MFIGILISLNSAWATDCTVVASSQAVPADGAQGVTLQTKPLVVVESGACATDALRTALIRDSDGAVVATAELPPLAESRSAIAQLVSEDSLMASADYTIRLEDDTTVYSETSFRTGGSGSVASLHDPPAVAVVDLIREKGASAPADLSFVIEADGTVIGTYGYSVTDLASGLALWGALVEESPIWDDIVWTDSVNDPFAERCFLVTEYRTTGDSKTAEMCGAATPGDIGDDEPQTDPDTGFMDTGESPRSGGCSHGAIGTLALSGWMGLVGLAATARRNEWSQR